MRPRRVRGNGEQDLFFDMNNKQFVSCLELLSETSLPCFDADFWRKFGDVSKRLMKYFE